MAKSAALRVTLDARSKKLTTRLIKSGLYASADQAVSAAMRLLEAQQRERAEEIAAVRRGLEDVRAGRTRPADDVFADLRRAIERRRK
jgi:antitoxin ParD1/3/4